MFVVKCKKDSGIPCVRGTCEADDNTECQCPPGWGGPICDKSEIFHFLKSSLYICDAGSCLCIGVLINLSLIEVSAS